MVGVEFSVLHYVGYSIGAFAFTVGEYVVYLHPSVLVPFTEGVEGRAELGGTVNSSSIGKSIGYDLEFGGVGRSVKIPCQYKFFIGLGYCLYYLQGTEIAGVFALVVKVCVNKIKG